MTRLHNLIRKVGSEETGLEAAFYVHLDHDLAGKVRRVHFALPGKFANKQIERILQAIEAQINDALQEIVGGQR